MEPIISPWTIYLIEILDTLACISAIISLTAFLIIIVMLVDTIDIAENEERDKRIRQTFCFFAILVIGCICSALIPSKEGMYTMLAASYITPDNISSIGDSAYNSADKILELIINRMNELK